MEISRERNGEESAEEDREKGPASAEEEKEESAVGGESRERGAQRAE